LFGRALLLRLANSPTIERFVKRNGVSAGFVRRFVAGETLEETVAPIRALNTRGIAVSLDYLGEHARSVDEAKASVAYYHRVIRFIDENALDANISLKLTQLGMDIGDDLARENLRHILEEAARFALFVRIDMEGSAYTARTLDIFYRLWPEYQNVGVVIQAYLYRSAEDVENLIEAGARVRLCKGAYSEPKEIAFARKRDVDRNFLSLAQRLLKHGHYPAIATHDVAIIRATKQFAREEGIAPDRYEYQMLYGVGRDMQSALVQEGFRVRVYVPFGAQWYGYLMRRLAERPANLWFVLKNLFRR